LLIHQGLRTPIELGPKSYDNNLPKPTQRAPPEKFDPPPERPAELEGLVGPKLPTKTPAEVEVPTGPKFPTEPPAETKATAAHKLPTDQPAKTGTLTAISEALSPELLEEDIPSTITTVAAVDPETLRITTEALFSAVEDEDLEAIKAQLVLGAPIDAVDDLGFTVLHYATDAGQLEIVEFLIASGCEIDKRCQSTDRPTALYLACLKKHIKHRAIAKVLLDAGADPNIKDESRSFTILHSCVRDGAIWAVEMLLASSKADLNPRATDNTTPIHVASYLGYLGILRLLFAAGADKLAKGYYGQSALHYAVSTRKEEIVKFLLEQGIPVDVRDDAGRTALHQAIYGQLNVVKLLLEGGADPDAKENSGYTPLHYASARGFVDVMKVLVDGGSNVNAKTIKTVTPLMDAADSGFHAAVKFLLEKGADVDIVCTAIHGGQRTAMDLAKAQSHISVIRTLQRHIAVGKSIG
jgi:ankyrin repeat protein